MTENSQGWRPLIAVFANPDARSVAAGLMRGHDLEHQLAAFSSSRRAHYENLLLKSGFVTREGDELHFVASVFDDVLRA